MTNDVTNMSKPMNKEEMIDTLKGLVFGTFDRTTAKEREALDMAIKALEQEPCNDAISREEVLRHRHVVQNNDWIGCCVVRVDEIIKLPSVTPKAESEDKE